MSQTLVDAPEIELSTSVELVIPATLECPLCGPLDLEYAFAAPALFIDGGYGAVTVRRVRTCECGNRRLVDTTTENPRSYPGLIRSQKTTSTGPPKR